MVHLLHGVKYICYPWFPATPVSIQGPKTDSPPMKGYFVGVCVVYARLLRRVCLSMYWESFTHLRLMRGWNR